MLDKLTIADVLKFFGNLQQSTEVSMPIGAYVIVRTYSAGVHYGTLLEVNGKTVKLANARRLWQWTGGSFTLSEIANEGVKGGKISQEVQSIVLTEAIEIIPTSSEAEKCLKNFQSHKV